MSEPSKDQSSQSQRTILVTGSTGRQGHALVTALSSSTEQFNVLALTRDPNSIAAQQLLKETERNGNLTVSLIQGDLDDSKSIRGIFEDAEKGGGIWGVFAVFAFPGLGANADGEAKQGIVRGYFFQFTELFMTVCPFQSLADISQFGVEYFVLSTVERGGEVHDDNLVLDSAVKVKIERHVKLLGSKGLNWMLVFFIERVMV